MVLTNASTSPSGVAGLRTVVGGPSDCASGVLVVLTQSHPQVQRPRHRGDYLANTTHLQVSLFVSNDKINEVAFPLVFNPCISPGW